MNWRLQPCLLSEHNANLVFYEQRSRRSKKKVVDLKYIDFNVAKEEENIK